MDTRTQSVDNRGKRGKHASGDVWTKKLKCSCSGGSFNRRVWHRTSSGEPQYAYQCYKQISTGTIATRMKKGLSLEGICEAPMVPRWKLSMFGDDTRMKLCVNKDKSVEVEKAPNVDTHCTGIFKGNKELIEKE